MGAAFGAEEPSSAEDPPKASVTGAAVPSSRAPPSADDDIAVGTEVRQFVKLGEALAQREAERAAEDLAQTLEMVEEVAEEVEAEAEAIVGHTFGHGHHIHKKVWGEDTRLCGRSLVAQPEGLSLLFWGAHHGTSASKKVAVFTSRYAKSDHEGVYIRCVSSDHNASSPGLLMETEESHPLAYLSTDYMAVWCGAHPKQRSCAIFRNDLSLFALAYCAENSNRVTVQQRNQTIASVTLDSVTGTHANVLSPAGHLLGNVVPNDPDLCHPVRHDEDTDESNYRVWGSTRPDLFKHSQPKKRAFNRVVNIAPGVDAGLVLTTIIAAVKMGIGNL
mmetsp:Transcript_136249/g.236905  ORF Transcript_136249/g.236905 Transcript_136249/m.236905 type:complete len:332 (-) Transcript_136249:61-1056(-)